MTLHSSRNIHFGLGRRPSIPRRATRSSRSLFPTASKFRSSLLLRESETLTSENTLFLLVSASMDSSTTPRCESLVLDAGPLLSLSPLRGLAKTYYTVPQVLDELKDKRAREHFERLGLSAGVRIEISSPDAASLAHGKSDIES